MYIKLKVGECVDCKDGVSKPLIAGRCEFHYKIHRYVLNKKKRDERFSKPLNDAFGMDDEKSKLVLWYADGMKNWEPVCENCGCKINKNNKEEWHGSQAHILPKGIFESVKTHPFNRVILCRFGNFCHGKYDSRWDVACKMKVFPLVRERFEKFKHLITSRDELRRIPDCFLN